MPLTDAERKQQEYEETIRKAAQNAVLKKTDPTAEEFLRSYFRNAAVARLARADAEDRETSGLVAEQFARGMYQPITGLAARAAGFLPEQTKRRLRGSGAIPYGDAETVQAVEGAFQSAAYERYPEGKLGGALKIGMAVGQQLPAMIGAGMTGGLPALVTYYGTTSANESYSEAKNKGIDDATALKYAAVAGATEVAVTSAFAGAGKLLAGSKVAPAGLGGAERVAASYGSKAKETSEGVLKALLPKTQTLADYGSEVVEEVVIETINNLARAGFEVDMEAADRERMVESAWQAALQAVAMTGALKTPKYMADVGGQIRDKVQRKGFYTDEVTDGSEIIDAAKSPDPAPEQQAAQQESPQQQPEAEFDPLQIASDFLNNNRTDVDSPDFQAAKSVFAQNENPDAQEFAKQLEKKEFEIRAILAAAKNATQPAAEPQTAPDATADPAATPEPEVAEPLSAEEQFVQDGTVPGGMLDAIATKISQGEELTGFEQDVRNANSEDVNRILEERKAAAAPTSAQEPEVTPPETPPTDPFETVVKGFEEAIGEGRTFNETEKLQRAQFEAGDDSSITQGFANRAFNQAVANIKARTEQGAEDGEEEAGQEAARQPRVDRANPNNRPEVANVGRPGKEGTLNLADGKTTKVRYYVVEADDLTPSHDARRNYRSNLLEGEEENERAYGDTDQGRASRETVRNIAQVDPSKVELLTSDNPTATDGPPMVEALGLVLGGNARAMGMQLAYSNEDNPEAAARLKKQMVDSAAKFGINPDDVERMDQPIIVRELLEADSFANLSRLLNENLTTAKPAETEAVSRGKAVSVDTARAIGSAMQSQGDEFLSMRDVLGNAKIAGKIIDLLRSDGAWTNADSTRYLNAQGNLNEDGKNVIEAMLVGRVIDDPAIAGAAPPVVKQKLLFAMGAITAMSADETHGKRFGEILKTAIEAYPEYKASGQSASEFFLKQQSLIEFAGQGDPSVMAVADALEKLPLRKFRGAMKELATALNINDQGQMGFFDDGSTETDVDTAIAQQYAERTQQPTIGRKKGKPDEQPLGDKRKPDSTDSRGPDADQPSGVRRPAGRADEQKTGRGSDPERVDGPDGGTDRPGRTGGDDTADTTDADGAGVGGQRRSEPRDADRPEAGGTTGADGGGQPPVDGEQRGSGEVDEESGLSSDAMESIRQKMKAKFAEDKPQEKQPKKKRGVQKKSSEKQPKPISQEKAKAQQDVDDAAQKLIDLVRGSDIPSDTTDMLAGLPADQLIDAAVEYVSAQLKLKAITFREFALLAIEKFGDAIEALAPYLEAAWRVAREMGMTKEKAGKILDFREAAQSRPTAAASPAQPTGDEFQVVYSPSSKAGAFGTLLPKNHEDAVNKALAELAEKHGSVDQFVGDRLGFTPEEMKDGRLSGEQIDAVALAIAAHEGNRAYINGDQTGIGKGRVAAAMIRYAQHHLKKVPTFFTIDPPLFANMMEDLEAIGVKNVKPLMVNAITGSKAIKLPDGTTLSQEREDSDNKLTQVAESLAKGNAAKADGETYNVIFATYSQLSPAPDGEYKRVALLRSIAKSSFMILDESHKAGGSAASGADSRDGSPTLAGNMRRILANAFGAYFSSATWSKSPATTDLYALTGMAAATYNNAALLAETIRAGGVPLQQVNSQMAVENGTMMRRERDFTGIEFSPQVVEVDLDPIDKTAEILSAINAFDQEKKKVTKRLHRHRNRMNESLPKGQTITKVSDTRFTQRLNDVSSALLLALKAEATADAAIDSLDNGESPVIYIDNTFESMLVEYAKSKGIEVGEEIDITYKDFLLDYLEKARTVTYTREVANEEGQIKTVKEKKRLPDDDLPEAMLRQFKKAKELIEKSDIDLPASPIDAIRKKLEDNNRSVAEITGRKNVINYIDGKPRLSKRPAAETGPQGINNSINGFNSKKIDVLIINEKGATGVNMHASEQFENQQKRRMIIAQAAKNIDTFMQSLGRVNRTGQVVKPAYNLIMTNAPAETRPASMLVQKLAGLNANVTASDQGSVSFDTPNIYNRIGDNIVAEYVAERPSLNDELGGLVRVNRNNQPKKTEGVALKVSGRMIMMPRAEQDAFWEAVTFAFNEQIAALDAINKNPLSVKTVDMQAETLETLQIFEGEADASNVYERPAFLEKVSSEKQGEPYSSNEVTESVHKFYGHDPQGRATLQGSSNQWLDKTMQQVESQVEQKLGEIKDPASRKKQGRHQSDQLQKLRELLYKFAPGKNIMYVEGEFLEGQVNSLTDGVVLSLTHKSKSGFATARSGWFAEIALASPDKVISVPLSRLISSEPDQDFAVLSGDGKFMEQRVLDRFDEPSSSNKEVRYIATGNLLAAFALVKDEQGRVTFYTDKEGNQKTGILLPRKFVFADWQKKQPIAASTVSDVRAILALDGFLKTPDGIVTITAPNKFSALQVSFKNDQMRSRAYLEDKGITDAAKQDYEPYGSGYVKVTVRKRADQDALIQHLLDAYGVVSPKQSANEKATWTDEKMTVPSMEPDAKQKRLGGKRGPKTTQQQQKRLGARKAVTEEGKALLNEIANDGDKREVGMPSIARFLIEAFEGIPFFTRSQTTAKSPALFRDQGSAIFTRSSDFSGNLHEAGHAMYAMLTDTNPLWLFEKMNDMADLAAKNMEDGLASAPTAKEGFAEFVRLFVTDPASLDPALKREVENMIAKVDVQALNVLRDAAIAHARHISRPEAEQDIANRNDAAMQSSKLDKFMQGAKIGAVHIFGEGNVPHMIMQQLYAKATGTNAAEMADPTPLSRLMRSVFKRRSAQQQRNAEEVAAEMENMHDTPADLDRAHADRLRAPAEIGQALQGSKSFQGIAVMLGDNGFANLDDGDLNKLRRAGFSIPERADFARQGQEQVLHDKSLQQIMDSIPDSEYAEFEQAAMDRAAVERWEKNQQEYPGRNDPATPHRHPAALKKSVDEAFAENPHWEQAAADIKKFMDQSLLLSLLSGTKSADELAKIITEYKYYVPLQRQQGDVGAGSRGSISASDPNFGIYRAYGSLRPYLNIENSVINRITRAIGDYHTNAVNRAVLEFSRSIANNRAFPFDVRKDAEQMMIPLKKDIAVAAKIPKEEMVKIAANFANRQILTDSGVNVDGLKDSELEAKFEETNKSQFFIKPENINFEVLGRTEYRQVRPNMPSVQGVFENGKLTYYLVNDPLMNMFMRMSVGDSRTGKGGNALLKFITRSFNEVAKPWKEQYTRTLGFLVNNLIRDAQTAMVNHPDIDANKFVPYMFQAQALMAQLGIGKGAEFADMANKAAEYRASYVDAADAPANKKLLKSFVNLITDGIYREGFLGQSTGEKVTSLFGIASSIVLKPMDIITTLTGLKKASDFTESLTRKGAFIVAKKKGLSDAKARERFDKISGNFAQRQYNRSAAELVKGMGFLNPNLQILSQLVVSVTPWNPAKRHKLNAYMVASLVGVGIASKIAEIMLSEMLEDDDERYDRLLRAAETPEQEKLRSMAIPQPWGGTLRLPYDNNITGAIVSYAANTFGEWYYGSDFIADLRGEKAVKTDVDSAERRWELLKKSAGSVGFNIGSFLPPRVGTAVELSANENFYLGSEIVPQNLLDRNLGNDHMAFYNSTPELYVWASNKLRSMPFFEPSVSPLTIQHGFRGLTHSFYDDTIKYLDKVKRGGVDHLKDNPFTRGLQNRDPRGFYSRSVQRVMDDVAEGRKIELELKDNKGLSNEQKATQRKKLKELQEIMAVGKQLEELRAEARLYAMDDELRDPVKEAEISRKMSDIARGFIMDDKRDISYMNAYFDEQMDKVTPYQPTKNKAYKDGKGSPTLTMKPVRPGIARPAAGSVGNAQAKAQWKKYDEDFTAYKKSSKKLASFQLDMDLAREFTVDYMKWLANNTDQPGVPEKIDEILKSEDLLKIVDPNNEPYIPRARKGVDRVKQLREYLEAKKTRKRAIAQAQQLYQVRKAILKQRDFQKAAAEQQELERLQEVNPAAN